MFRDYLLVQEHPTWPVEKDFSNARASYINYMKEYHPRWITPNPIMHDGNTNDFYLFHL